MVLLQHKLNVKLSQKQILTPGLVQMVSVLALNKLELKDMINEEMVENPVLDELDTEVPLLDEVAGKEVEKDRLLSTEAPAPEAEKTDPFDEIDFGSYFQDYLDPGYRSPASEVVEKPSFENFLSTPTTLTDHLMWQVSSMMLRAPVREAAELIIGNLNEDGYLTASEEELLGAPPEHVELEEVSSEAPSSEEADAILRAALGLNGGHTAQSTAAAVLPGIAAETSPFGVATEIAAPEEAEAEPHAAEVVSIDHGRHHHHVAADAPGSTHFSKPSFNREELREALDLVKQMDPVGVGSRDMRECLLAQLHHQQHLRQQQGLNGELERTICDATTIVRDHLRALQLKQYKEIGKAIDRPLEAVMTALDYIKTLDPRPGLRYNKVETRLIEPDVFFVKQTDDYVVLMNEDDLPQLRLNPTYKKLLSRENAEKEVRTYVKERYKSAIQLIKNIEQRKQTILKVCYAIIGRQRDFLDRGIDQLKPMMIKEVAEEIGVHPSTVSRAVANQYAHTPQGVFELRYFFSESVQGPEGGGTSLLILKRRVKKLIEDEDPLRPLTDEQITRILQSQGIQVTRRTVAKYREDMKIPSTHQRRVKN